jgi:hypothetical protein
MYTSIAMLALSSLLGALPQEPAWQSDYQRAYKQGKAEKKPLAVFIGAGRNGYLKIAEEGKLTPETKLLLTEKYVCVYLDIATKGGQESAAGFRLDTGIVLSDRVGEMQAFRHGGILSGKDLVKYLEQFARPNLVVRTTTRHGVDRSSYYPAESPIVQQSFGGRVGGC